MAVLVVAVDAVVATSVSEWTAEERGVARMIHSLTLVATAKIGYEFILNAIAVIPLLQRIRMS